MEHTSTLFVKDTISFREWVYKETEDLYFTSPHCAICGYEPYEWDENDPTDEGHAVDTTKWVSEEEITVCPLCIKKYNAIEGI